MHKENSKWIKYLNVRPKTIKLLEENIGRTLNDINQSKILYDPLPRIMEIKAKVNKSDLIKLKSFATSQIIREVQIKTTMRYYFTHVRMAITKSANNKCWR